MGGFKSRNRKRFKKIEPLSSVCVWAREHQRTVPNFRATLASCKFSYKPPLEPFRGQFRGLFRGPFREPFREPDTTRTGLSSAAIRTSQSPDKFINRFRTAQAKLPVDARGTSPTTTRAGLPNQNNPFAFLPNRVVPPLPVYPSQTLPPISCIQSNNSSDFVTQSNPPSAFFSSTIYRDRKMKTGGKKKTAKQIFSDPKTLNGHRLEASPGVFP